MHWSLIQTIVFWFAAVLCLMAQGMVLRSLLLGRTPAARTGTAARAREVAWVLIPAIVMVLVLIASWRAIHESTASAAAPVQTVLEPAEAVR